MNMKLTRAKFEQIVGDLIKKTVEPCIKVNKLTPFCCKRNINIDSPKRMGISPVIFFPGSIA